jgi:hypothetical protein
VLEKVTAKKNGREKDKKGRKGSSQGREGKTKEKILGREK